uniref:Ribosomal-protein-alanine N-acetyltransferase n=1 Tax=Staphylothermus marinus TaxID=2280 RepID=A0A7C4H8Z9_STAMA
MVENDLIIREFNLGDIDSVLDIENKSFSEKMRYDREVFIKLYRRNPDLFLVAQYRDRIVGYIIASHIEDFGHIISIAVHPYYRNRGIGSKLLNAIEDKLLSKGVRLISLEVSVSNNTALKLYRKHGYEPVKILKNYYGHEDAVLMIKYLENKNNQSY